MVLVRMTFMATAFWAAGCGERWAPAEHDGNAFPLACAHADAACASCHPADEPLGAVDPACIACHEAERPASHDPATTQQCDDCHSSACDWATVESAHPEGYDRPEQHGLDANLQLSDCTVCHGTTWEGGTGPGCDDCHTAEGHPDWRTDCSFCHGQDASGMPPRDIDGEADGAAISFPGHGAHADPAGIGHPAYGCDTCHVVPTTALSTGHAIDASPGAAEVAFGGLAVGSSFSQGSCTTWCHGDGLGTGVVSVDDPAMGCDSCHASTSPWAGMSGSHATHLGRPDTDCASCHAPVAGGGLIIDDSDRHVDGELHVDLGATGFDEVANSCTIACHGYDHQGLEWGGGGHPPGYDDPLEHGTDALTGTTVCTSCHGADLQGGSSGQGCDDCHVPGWRSDCVYCHGGSDGDLTGRPPEDLDNTTAVAQISFQAHPPHGEGTRHPVYACDNCHPGGPYADALLDAGHWFDPTPGVAEVSFAGAVQPGGSYAGTTCSNVYCHGDGRGTGTVSDGAIAYACDDCHPDQTSNGDDWDGMSGEHKKHLEEGYACYECHDSVVDAGQGLIGPALHVDGQPTVSLLPATGITYNGSTCSGGSCHGSGHNHSNDGW